MIKLRKFAILLLVIFSLLGLSAISSVGASAANGSWETFSNLPTFNPGNMVLLTDGSVLMADHGGDQTGTPNWWILKPDSKGNYSTGTWKIGRAHV